jgi:glutamyl-tRNA synthetase
VLRGEDLLSSTPRQIALHHALVEIGVAEFIPRFGHLPYVLGEGSKKLSKRDPESNLFHHRDRGFLPEGLLNYLALLGWSIAADRDVFTMDEMCAAFDVADVNPNPARFDLKKAEAINGEHMRLLAPEEFAGRLVPYLQQAGFVASPEATDAQLELVRAAAPLVQERMQLLGETPDMLGFLFVPANEIEYQDDALKTLKDGAVDVIAATAEALAAVDDWSTAAIEAAMRGKLIDELGHKPRLAFGPARVALSGRRISPPLFESMELLGRDETLARLERLRAHLSA